MSVKLTNMEMEGLDSEDEESEDNFSLVMLDSKGKAMDGESKLLLGDVGPSSSKPDEVKLGNYEEALEKAGFGKFHVILVLVCGWANVSDALEILSISFILPAAETDLQLTSYMKGVLSAIIFVGMLIGGYVWGALADINGRRRTLIFSLFTNAFFGLMSSIAQVYWLFLLMRFCSGVGVGGAIPIIFSYFGEFQPKNRRGMMISILSTFWMAGNILAAFLALVIIPSDIHFSAPGFSFNSWRVFLAVCTIPALTSVILMIYMPESPKFLLENGQSNKALKVMQRIYSSNTGDDKSNYQLKTLIPSENVRQLNVNHGGRRTCKDRMQEVLDNTQTSIHMTMQLFKKPLTFMTITLLLIIWTLSFGYYGLWMWMPELFKQAEMTNGSVCAVTPDMGNTTLAPQPPDDTIYWDSFYTSISNLPGNLVTIFLIDIIGRKFLMSASLLVSGVIVFFIWFVSTRTHIIIVFCCFGGVSVIAWNVLNVMAVEVYPTHMRSTAFGVQGVINRLASIVGNVIFGILIQTHCAVNILLVAALLVFGGLLSLTLPRTKKISLQ
ncbi:synaptic vesicle glycoprotein 2C-like [Asterias amurensis]|uniref:synaptic vesicle glycoprotein 2C-like n=1 Tax=Asterias amurensis TaxID=7602 RepID=UPI003AB8FD8A